MEDRLFDTKEKRDAAIAAFKTGVNTPFWQLMTQILEANIRVVTKQILDGGPDITKEQMDRLRDKLKVHKNVIKTPEIMIEKLTSPEGEEPNLDPFSTAEELSAEKLKEERKKVSG